MGQRSRTEAGLRDEADKDVADVRSADEPAAGRADDVPSTGLPLVSGVQRVLLAALAGLCLALAVVGAILPGMPSTVFVLIAAWAAARSSPRMHAWLYRCAWFGPSLRNWRDGRKVSRRSKHVTALSMAGCAAILLWLDARGWPTWLAIGCMAVVLTWLWSRPEPEE